MWVAQFYKFDTDDLLDEKHDMEGIYDSKSTYILKIKCTKDTKFDYQTCTEYGQVERYSRAMGNSKRAIIL